MRLLSVSVKYQLIYDRNFIKITVNTLLILANPTNDAVIKLVLQVSQKMVLILLTTQKRSW